MSGQRTDVERRVVPRWRPAKVQARLSSDGSGTHPVEEPGVSELAPLLEAFRRSPSPYFASDLMGAAYVLGRRDEALEAADFLVKSGGNVPHVALDLAERLLHELGVPLVSEPPRVGVPVRKERIGRLRRILRGSPRNPLAWLDLSLEQAALGQTEAAARPVRVALGLAPSSRLVLRSASRYYLHAEDRERAHDLLRRSPRIGGEPLLLAAEISAAGAAGRTSRFIKHGRRLLTSGRFSAREMSELAAAIGTLEAEGGSGRAARRILDRALEDPTENTIAQCSWLASRRYLTGFEVPPELLRTPLSFEANALETMTKGDYASSVEAAMDWLHDEPFASRPAVHGSFLNSMVLSRHSDAADFADQGLIANPDDPYLLNNSAFARACLDDVGGAQEQLKKLESLILDAEHRPMFLATSGLVAYRSGHRLVGRSLYTQAAEAAIEGRQYRDAVWALLLAAREEDRLEPGAGRQLRGEAARHLESLSRLDRAVADVLLSARS